MTWHVTSRHVTSCPVLSCPFLSCPVMSCHVMSCHVLPCPVLSCCWRVRGCVLHNAILDPDETRLCFQNIEIKVAGPLLVVCKQILSQVKYMDWCSEQSSLLNIWICIRERIGTLYEVYDDQRSPYTQPDTFDLKRERCSSSQLSLFLFIFSLVLCCASCVRLLFFVYVSICTI